MKVLQAGGLLSVGNTHQLPESDIHGRYIWDAIREGLWPFKPRMITLYLEFDIDFNRHVLFAEVQFADRSRLQKRVTMDAWDVAKDPEAAAHKAAIEMFEAFRYRDDYPLPNKIVLGEN